MQEEPREVSDDEEDDESIESGTDEEPESSSLVVKIKPLNKRKQKKAVQELPEEEEPEDICKYFSNNRDDANRDDEFTEKEKNSQMIYALLVSFHFHTVARELPQWPLDDEPEQSATPRATGRGAKRNVTGTTREGEAIPRTLSNIKKSVAASGRSTGVKSTDQVLQEIQREQEELDSPQYQLVQEQRRVRTKAARKEPPSAALGRNFLKKNYDTHSILLFRDTKIYSSLPANLF